VTPKIEIITYPFCLHWTFDVAFVRPSGREPYFWDIRMGPIRLEASYSGDDDSGLIIECVTCKKEATQLTIMIEVRKILREKEEIQV